MIVSNLLTAVRITLAIQLHTRLLSLFRVQGWLKRKRIMSKKFLRRFSPPRLQLLLGAQERHQNGLTRPQAHVQQEHYCRNHGICMYEAFSCSIRKKRLQQQQQRWRNHDTSSLTWAGGKIPQNPLPWPLYSGGGSYE